MKFLLLITVGCYIVTCMHLTAASPYANANADPDPLVGTRIKKTCEESLKDATSHTALCEKAANHVVDKVGKACNKAFKYGCTLASFAVEYQKCYDTMKNLICPANKPASVQIEGETEVDTTTDTKEEETTSDADHPSWIGRVIIRRCDNYLKPVADNITQNGQTDFKVGPFCKELGHNGRDICVKSIIGQCENFPKDWDTARGICKDYVIPWICK